MSAVTASAVLESGYQSTPRANSEQKFISLRAVFCQAKNHVPTPKTDFLSGAKVERGPTRVHPTCDTFSFSDLRIRPLQPSPWAAAGDFQAFLMARIITHRHYKHGCLQHFHCPHDFLLTHHHDKCTNSNNTNLTKQLSKFRQQFRGHYHARIDTFHFINGFYRGFVGGGEFGE